MVIVMEEGASKELISSVIARIEELGYKPHPMYGVQRTVIGAIGDERGKGVLNTIQSMPGVERIVPILAEYKLASHQLKGDKTVVKIKEGVEIGGNQVVIMAGPCSVEGEAQLIETARHVREAGAHILRGGAYKPRTSPYAFQGMEEEGLKLLARAREETGLPVITEVMDAHDVDLISEYADILQVGARNVQNFTLLKKLGRCSKPVFLKRGMSTTIKEWLMAAEYILSEGNRDVILCERGIRTFETATRNTLDLSAIPVVKEKSHLPIVVDPSHGTGAWQYVASMAKASVASGADGLMIEVHPRPQEAWSDGPQSLRPDKFKALMEELRPLVEAVGREF